MTKSPGQRMAFALRLYRWLLIAYPRSFRSAYGGEMAGVFRERGLRALDEQGKTCFGFFFLRAILDLLTNAALERARILWSHDPLPNQCANPKRGDPMLLNLWKDVVFAARTARRQPGFAAIAIITLTLGIGVLVSLFSATIVTRAFLEFFSMPFFERKKWLF